LRFGAKRRVKRRGLSRHRHCLRQSGSRRVRDWLEKEESKRHAARGGIVTSNW
jgi:hypothetical protein